MKALPLEISNFKIPVLEYTNNGNGNSNGADIIEIKETKHDLKNAALEAEYETIIKVLREVNFNKTKAAEVLNIDRKTLYNKMKAINLK